MYYLLFIFSTNTLSVCTIVNEPIANLQQAFIPTSSNLQMILSKPNVKNGQVQGIFKVWV